MGTDMGTFMGTAAGAAAAQAQAERMHEGMAARRQAAVVQGPHAFLRAGAAASDARKVMVTGKLRTTGRSRP